MPLKIKVVMKGEDSNMSKEFLHYPETDGQVSMSKDDPKLKSMVESAVSCFKSPIDNIIIKSEFVWE